MAFETLIFTHKLKGVKLRRPFHEPVTGTLCITGHHLIFHCPANKFQELWVLHHSINTVEKHMESPLNGGTLTLKCKDFKVLHFDIKQYQEFLNVLKSIERLTNFRTVEFQYPFFYQPMYTLFEDGYTLFKIESEFSKLLATDAWRISHVNKDYDVCKTYSAAIIVPKIISDDIIVASANFREGGRFPVLSYRHESGAILLRSSQPLLNSCYRRCSDDENILNALLSPLHKGYIIDTRSASYINSCKAKGGGTEPDEHYIQWKKVFTPLDKISKCDGSVLDSLTKLVDVHPVLVHPQMLLPYELGNNFSRLDVVQYL